MMLTRATYEMGVALCFIAKKQNETTINQSIIMKSYFFGWQYKALDTVRIHHDNKQ